MQIIFLEFNQTMNKVSFVIHFLVFVIKVSRPVLVDFD